ncbi:MAG: competence/damage-inducible protein A [Chloroflexi bacterium]|nr:competence/damage-inducible protein A [Chloroflexota bacterium]
MKAEIISTGTELLLGQITDTNSPYLASELPLLGIDLYWITHVGDNQKRIVEVLQRAWGRSDIIIVTGGLGPTEGDITRESIADMLGEKMKVDPELVENLRSLFRKLGIEMPQRNIKQANLIPSACAIPNTQGTAPGWWVEREGKIIIALPGPPRELQRMWEKEVKPKLSRKLSGEVIISRIIKTAGIPEAKVDEMVSPLCSSTNPTLALYAKFDGIHLRLTAKAAQKAKAEEMIAAAELRLKSILGDAIWGYDNDILESLVGDMLREKKLTLATMESCTGGLLASTITDVPGSSDYFKGGLVAYTAEMKIAFDVDAALLARKGTIDPEVAAAMAKTARLRMKADIGIGITGIAGPDAVEGKPVGTVHIAIDAGKRKSSFSATYPPRRADVKRRAVVSALFKLRQLLLKM